MAKNFPSFETIQLGRRLKEQIGYFSTGRSRSRDSSIRLRTPFQIKNEDAYHGLEEIPLHDRINDNDRAEIIFENHANRIMTKMEQDSDLMENTKESEKLRRDLIRTMPQCLTIKRSIKRKLTKTMSDKRRKRSTIGVFKSMQYRIGMKYTKMKNYMKNIISTYELWYDSLKIIEGRFGSGTSSYFKFLRSLFLMNISISIILILFIVIPQITIDRILDALKNIEVFQAADIFTGEGCLENSLLFYGYYSNQTANYYGVTLNMPLIYFFTMLFVYIVSFIILGYSVAVSYRRSFIESELGVKSLFAQKIFCGWDFGIATREASNLKSVAIYNELKELLSEIHLKNEVVPLFERLKILFVKAVANILILITLVSIGYLLWILLDMHKHNDIGPIGIAIIANFLNATLPLLFTKITSYENYKNPRNSVRITLIRSFLLSSVIVGVLVAFWLTHSFKQECWETSLGQEIYRLIIFDFLLSLLIQAVSILIYWIKRYGNTTVYFEFDVAVNTLDLIYNQSLFWMGLFFSPLLALTVTVKIFFLRYLKQYFLLKLCKPSAKAWRASQIQTWFLTLTFLTLLATTCLMVFILLKIPPTNCGPFGGYKFIYEVITTGFDREPIFLWKYFSYLMKPGVAALIIISLCVRVYYVRAKANAQRHMVKILRNLLVWGSKDRKFLIDYISQVTNGEWHYNRRERGREDPYLAVPNIEHLSNSREANT